MWNDGIVHDCWFRLDQYKLSPNYAMRINSIKGSECYQAEGPDNGGYWVVLMDLNV